MNTRSVMFRLWAGATGLLLASFGVVMLGSAAASADTAPAAGTPATVSADALPTWQVNGVVWSQVLVGNTVYVTGSFTQARPPGVAAGGAGSVTANNIFAYDITTGSRVASFNHSLNAQGNVIVASPDGSRLYVGGDFTTVDGASHSHIAAFNTSDGSLVTGFTASVSQRVAGIAATGSSVFIGGNFFSVNGSSRTRLAQVTAATGALMSWKATADNDNVTALVLTPDLSKLVVGGKFTTLNGVAASGMGALDVTSGATLPWAANQTIQDGGTNSKCGILSLKTDGTYIYGSGYAFGCGNFEGSFKADPSGALILANDCHGDTYDVAPIGGVLYTVSHAHDCRWMGGYPQTDSQWSINMRHSLAFTTDARGVNVGPDNYGWNYNGVPSSGLLQWFPTLAIGSTTGQSQAAWSVTGNSKYVALGGEFPSVNGAAQQGLVRFAVASIAPDKRGPSKVVNYAAPNAAPQNVGAVTMPDGSVRVTWQSAVDQDNSALTYNLYRSGTAAAINTQTANSNFWTYPMLGYRDAGAKAGTSYTYTVKATDPNNNTANLGSVTITAAAGNGNGTSTYSSDVQKDGASAYWPLSEASGSTVYDYAGFNDATAGTGVGRGAAGPVAGDSSTASTFSGNDSGNVASPSMPTTSAFSVEAWVKTTSTSGGKIVGYGGSNTGDSGSYDRHVYMDNAGRIWFGVYPNAVRTVNSSNAYNDGSWHHIVGTEGAGGMALYVDGKKVGSDGSTTGAQSYDGYWRIGGDNLNGWPSTNGISSNDFTGAIADVAIYPTALTLSQAQQHYTDAGGTGPTGPPAPTDAYGKAVYNSGPDLFWRFNEGTASTAIDYSGNQENGVVAGGVTAGQVSGVVGGGTTYTFNGSDGTVASTDPTAGPSTYSEELWFKTSTNRGGKLIGFGDAQSGRSNNYDRHVYMENTGQLTFGVWTGQANTITSSDAYNDGKWHYLVATQGADGMKLYLDGTMVGVNPQTAAQGYSGYWRVGGDSDWGGDSAFLDGSIDEVAVYGKVLGQDAISTHYAAGTPAANKPPTAAFSHSENKLKISVDGSASADPDGSVVSYTWSWGDGTADTTGTSATATHTYATADTYPVKLTVKDDGGATNSTTTSVAVSGNQAPTAAFSHTENKLKVSVDGSASADPDGSVASYTWSWGDGTADTTGTSATATHTYLTADTYPVKLTVTDNDGATNTTTTNVKVSDNQSPTASFTASNVDLKASVDGSGSSDPDGSVVSYSWSWGDGTADTTGTSATATHTYATADTYTVKLTVTDNDGATGSTTRTVPVTAPSAALASDAFARTVSNGWGTADRGGAWTIKGSASNFSVGGGLGNLVMPTAGAGPWAYLNTVSSTGTDTAVTVTLNKGGTGSGTYVAVLGRDIDAVGSYRASMNFRADGKVAVSLLRRAADGTQTVIGSTTVVPGLTYAAGDAVKIRFQVAGTGPTNLKVKVWRAGDAEPTAWLIAGSDSTAAYQVAGRVGIATTLAANATNAAVTAGFDDLVVNSVP